MPQKPKRRGLGRFVSPARLAEALRKAGGDERVTEELVRADVAAGAPATKRGVDLVGYAAWLLRQHGYGEAKP